MEIRFAKFSDLEQVVELEQANFSSQEQISIHFPLNSGKTGAKSLRLPLY